MVATRRRVHPRPGPHQPLLVWIDVHPADWVARNTGSEVERARDGLETAGRLGECPVAAAAVRARTLSQAQAQAIVDAVAVRPEAEARLVEFARSNSLRT